MASNPSSEHIPPSAENAPPVAEMHDNSKNAAPPKRPSPWSNGLIWVLLALAMLLSAAPTVVTWADDKWDIRRCAAPIATIRAGSQIRASDLNPIKVKQGELPVHPVMNSSRLVGLRAKVDLKPDQCISSDSLDEALFRFLIRLDGVVKEESVAVGSTVTIALAPSNGQDSRSGAVVENIAVIGLDEATIMVSVTKSQRATLVEYVGRTAISITEK